MSEIVVGTRGTEAVKERMVRDVSQAYVRHKVYSTKRSRKPLKYKTKKPKAGLQKLIYDLG